MSDRMHVATRKGLFTFDRIDENWSITQTNFLSDNCTLVHGDTRGDRPPLYCALDHGHFGAKLHRSRDEGETWDEIGIPVFPPRPEGEAPEIDSMGKTIPDSLQLVWALQCGGVDQPGRIWCGTIPGGLFKSDDDGDTWELVRSLWDHPDRKQWFGGGTDWPGIHSICIDPRNSRRIIVGVSCGGVWISEDDGETWSCHAKGMRAEYMPPEREFDQRIQDPHCVVQCPSQPEKFWAQHHNGVFRSVDDCATWIEIKNISPSTFGFPVVVHPDDGETAWLVPGISDEKRIPVDGQVVVTRTRDGGQNFDQLREGLPQDHAYDLVFRHSLDIDETGDRLAMGSTTGSVWISEDQGDSWTCLKHHLPPVYAVRFLKPQA
ncbi:MAG: exo-alpha-sialidase [Planctomycetota bacterium]|nr:exo-alpha-sialidase [Planctomycetota bacterium]